MPLVIQETYVELKSHCSNIFLHSAVGLPTEISFRETPLQHILSLLSYLTNARGRINVGRPTLSRVGNRDCLPQSHPQTLKLFLGGKHANRVTVIVARTCAKKNKLNACTRLCADSHTDITLWRIRFLLVRHPTLQSQPTSHKNCPESSLPLGFLFRPWNDCFSARASTY